MTSTLRYSTAVSLYFRFFITPFYKKYTTLDKRARTSLAKQVVDTLDDRELSRDRIILQRIIDRGYTSAFISISISTARELIITSISSMFCRWLFVSINEKKNGILRIFAIYQRKYVNLRLHN